MVDGMRHDGQNRDSIDIKKRQSEVTLEQKESLYS